MGRGIGQFGFKKVTADLIPTSPRHKLEHLCGRQCKNTSLMILPVHERGANKKLPGKTVLLPCKLIFPNSRSKYGFLKS